MKLKCVDCGREDEGESKHARRAKMGLGLHCHRCGRSTPHTIVHEEPKDSEQPHEIDDVLVEHCDMHTGGEGVLIPTGCDKCVIATFHDDERDCFRAVISLQRLQAHFEEEFKDDEEPEVAASEWIGFNVLGAYMGPQTPMYVDEVENR